MARNDERELHYGDPGYEEELVAWEADQERWSAYSRPTDGYTQRELAAIYGFDYEDVDYEELDGRAEAGADAEPEVAAYRFDDEEPEDFGDFDEIPF